MTDKSSNPAGAWLRWVAGHHLDNFARWLVPRAPGLSALYASWWTPRTPRLKAVPGWTFAQELYPQQLWSACRRDAFWKTALKHGLAIPVSVRFYGGIKVDVTLGNDNSLCLYVCGSFEPNEFAFLDSVLKPGMTFVDVGGNDGYYALFASTKVGNAGRVVTVEPSSRERSHLERNIARNEIQNVTVVAAALGAAAGFVELKVADDLHAGHNTLGDFAQDDVVRAGTERVRMETLDGLAARLKLDRVDIIKIDVEGAEVGVVAGARQVLSSSRPILLLEVNDGALRAQGQSGNSLIELLRSEFNYTILAYSEATGRPAPWSAGEPLSLNVVAVPAGQSNQRSADRRFNS